jgi:hypothetical protein
MDCVAFLCVVAPLRDHFLLWESISRKAAKALSSPEGPTTLQSLPFRRETDFLILYSGVQKPFQKTLGRGCRIIARGFNPGFGINERQSPGRGGRIL